MASFQVHQDQENQISNARNIKGNRKAGKGPVVQKRSVLGLINTNSRLPTRKNDPKSGVQENVYSKSSSIFTVHEDTTCDSKAVFAENVTTTKAAGLVLRGGKKLECTVTSSKAAAEPSASSNESKNEASVLLAKVTEEKLDLTSNIMAVPRRPLKDITVFGACAEEEPMSEGSIIETESPMYIDKSLTLTLPSPSPIVEKEKQPKPTSLNIYDVDEYREDIFIYLKEAEKRHRPRPCYMRRQPDVTYSMRTVLVDWLVEVAEEYRLQTETLFLAISFVDRFLSLMSVVRGKLQLLGTSAMFIASKYEEIYPPDVNEFVYITDDTYNKKQVLRMEHLILKVLTFDLSVPTPLTFLSHLTVSCRLPETNLHLAMYLCELSLLEGDPYLQYLPSKLACSALATARHCLEYEVIWPEDLERASGYEMSELTDCICSLNETHSKAKTIPQQAVFDKYKVNKWHNVSELPHRQLTIKEGVILDL